jgi:murein DD-endopeptidase MepM/ murein hydrolase activator NlpD
MPARRSPRRGRRKRALFPNSVMRRRGFVGAALSLAASHAWADDKPVRFSVTGALTQGSLALGSAPPGSLVALDGRPLRVTADGRFAFGFGPDQTKASLVTVRYSDSGGDSRSFTPTARQYEVQRVNGLPQKTVTPPPDVEARIAHEAETIYLARLTDSAGSDFLAGFDWPAPGIESGVFGSQRIDNGVAMSPHYGVDMAAPVGTPIHAPADGMVSISDDYYLDGGFTLIDHGQGVSTSYLHQSKRLVKPGEAVKRGQRIGLIGATGRATGPHLHWAMNWFEVRLDPSLSTRKPKPDPL